MTQATLDLGIDAPAAPARSGSRSPLRLCRCKAETRAPKRDGWEFHLGEWLCSHCWGEVQARQAARDRRVDYLAALLERVYDAVWSEDEAAPHALEPGPVSQRLETWLAEVTR